MEALVFVSWSKLLLLPDGPLLQLSLLMLSTF
jgi:hypothetical protein